MADHNDPNAVNSIFSDIDYSAADLYDLFGFPTHDGRNALLALTFSSTPKAGELDGDLLYRLLVTSEPRVALAHADDVSLESVLAYFDAVKDKYLGNFKPCEIRVIPLPGQRATVKFIGFPCSDFTTVVALNTVTPIQSPDGQTIQAFIGGRDDAFFNDLTGFFRSINYAPQFYHVPHTMPDVRELKIPKTLIELEGNDLFNYDPAFPDWGHGFKKELPPGALTWTGDRFGKDENGNFRFVYSGKDAQAGKNVNAVILELPMAYLTNTPADDRIINCWGESWVRKASNKIDRIPDHPFWLEHPLALIDALRLDEEL